MDEEYRKLTQPSAFLQIPDQGGSSRIEWELTTHWLASMEVELEFGKVKAKVGSRKKNYIYIEVWLSSSL
jgi:hypothetical protein